MTVIDTELNAALEQFTTAEDSNSFGERALSGTPGITSVMDFLRQRDGLESAVDFNSPEAQRGQLKNVSLKIDRDTGLALLELTGNGNNTGVEGDSSLTLVLDLKSLDQNARTNLAGELKRLAETGDRITSVLQSKIFETVREYVTEISLKNVKIEGSGARRNLPMLRFHNLENVELGGLNLDGAIFTGTWNGVKISGGTARDARFEIECKGECEISSDIRKARFKGSLGELKLKGALLVGTDFSSAKAKFIELLGSEDKAEVAEAASGYLDNAVFGKRSTVFTAGEENSRLINNLITYADREETPIPEFTAADLEEALSGPGPLKQSERIPGEGSDSIPFVKEDDHGVESAVLGPDASDGSILKIRLTREHQDDHATGVKAAKITKEKGAAPDFEGAKWEEVTAEAAFGACVEQYRHNIEAFLFVLDEILNGGGAPSEGDTPATKGDDDLYRVSPGSGESPAPGPAPEEEGEGGNYKVTGGTGVSEEEPAEQKSSAEEEQSSDSTPGSGAEPSAAPEATVPEPVISPFDAEGAQSSTGSDSPEEDSAVKETEEDSDPDSRRTETPGLKGTYCTRGQASKYLDITKDEVEELIRQGILIEASRENVPNLFGSPMPLKVESVRRHKTSLEDSAAVDPGPAEKNGPKSSLE